MLKSDRRSLALMDCQGGRLGGGTSQHPATAIACMVIGSTADGGRTSSNGSSLMMVSASREIGVGGGGPLVTQLAQVVLHGVVGVDCSFSQHESVAFGWQHCELLTMLTLGSELQAHADCTKCALS